MDRKKINILILISIFIIPIFNFLLVNVSASVDDLDTLTVSPSIVQVRPYSFTNGSGVESVLSTNQKYDFLQFECGTPKIDADSMEDMGTIIGMDSDGNKTISYWYRLGVRIPINIFTTLDKYDSTPMGHQVSKVTEPVLFTNIQRVVNWLSNEENGYPFVQTYTYLPSWKVTNIIPEGVSEVEVGSSNKHETYLRSWFADRYFYGGTLNLELIINPNIGLPASIDYDNYTLSTSMTAVKLATASTVGGFESGVLDTESQTLINGVSTISDTQTSTTEDQIKEDDIGAFGDVEGSDSTNKLSEDIYFSKNAVNLVSTQTYTEGGGSISSSSGAQLYPTNWNTGELALFNQKPTSNDTRWKVPYNFNALRPKLSVYVTNYQVNEYHARIDIEDEWLFFGTAGVRWSNSVVKSYAGISAWRVDNYYIHDNLGFQIDIFSKYKIIPKQGIYDEKELDVPKETREDEYWLQIIEGILAQQQSSSVFDDFGVWLRDYWVYIVIIAFGAVIAFVVVYRTIMGKGSSRGKEKQDINIRVDTSSQEQIQKLTKKIEELEKTKRSERYEG